MQSAWNFGMSAEWLPAPHQLYLVCFRTLEVSARSSGLTNGPIFPSSFRPATFLEQSPFRGATPYEQPSTPLKPPAAVLLRQAQTDTWWPRFPKRKSMRQQFMPWGGSKEASRLGSRRMIGTIQIPNQSVQRTEASRLTQRQIERRRRLAPVPDL